MHTGCCEIGADSAARLCSSCPILIYGRPVGIWSVAHGPTGSSATHWIPSLLLLFKNTHSLSSGENSSGRHNARKLCSLLLMLHNFLPAASWLCASRKMRKPAEFSLLIYCEYVKLNIHFTLAARWRPCCVVYLSFIAPRCSARALSSLVFLQWGSEFLLRISAVLHAEFTVRLSQF